MATAVSRRIFLQASGAAAIAPAAAQAPPAASAAPAAPGASAAAAEPARHAFFNADEAAIVEAAVVRLIPPDAVGPSALEAGVPAFIDRQLAGAWGAGERLYRSGPWQPGQPTQGYQLPFTPAELFRTALRAVHGSGFASLPGAQQDELLTQWQQGRGDLGGVPAQVFFESLLAMTIEGYFCDPVYGGNRGMAAWAMIGFPGAYGSYYDQVDRHGAAFDAPPRSLAEDGGGHVHVDPAIPATAPLPRRPAPRSSRR